MGLFDFFNKNKRNNLTTECEEYAKHSREAFSNGNTFEAQQFGLKVYYSLVENKDQINNLINTKNVALSLGNLMEGDCFTENDSILKAVGLSYYFLCRAIKEGINDPYLYAYRFSVVWEYNKVFYHLFAHSEGSSYNSDPFDILGQSSTAVYDHHMQGMQMADMLTEPRIARLDPALGNIFNEMFARYSSTPKEQIISLGNKYHDQVYNYLKEKIESKDFGF